jgi:hypothetical protein
MHNSFDMTLAAKAFFIFCICTATVCVWAYRRNREDLEEEVVPELEVKQEPEEEKPVILDSWTDEDMIIFAQAMVCQ